MMPLFVNLVGMRCKFALSAIVSGLLAATAAAAEPMTSRQEPLPDRVWEEMQGSSWHPNRRCPARDDLVLLTVPYRDFAGAAALGRLVVAKRVADQVASIFTAIFESQTFRIERMELVDKYRGNDDASMAANNTSAFNCRFVGGTTVLSAHALGSRTTSIRPRERPQQRRAIAASIQAASASSISLRTCASFRPVRAGT